MWIFFAVKQNTEPTVMQIVDLQRLTGQAATQKHTDLHYARYAHGCEIKQFTIHMHEARESESSIMFARLFNMLESIIYLHNPCTPTRPLHFNAYSFICRWPSCVVCRRFACRFHRLGSTR